MKPLKRCRIDFMAWYFCYVFEHWSIFQWVCTVLCSNSISDSWFDRRQSEGWKEAEWERNRENARERKWQSSRESECECSILFVQNVENVKRQKKGLNRNSICETDWWGEISISCSHTRVVCFGKAVEYLNHGCHIFADVICVPIASFSFHFITNLNFTFTYFRLTHIFRALYHLALLVDRQMFCYQ